MPNFLIKMSTSRVRKTRALSQTYRTGRITVHYSWLLMTETANHSNFSTFERSRRAFFQVAFSSWIFSKAKKDIWIWKIFLDESAEWRTAMTSMTTAVLETNSPESATLTTTPPTAPGPENMAETGWLLQSLSFASDASLELIMIALHSLVN
jgi:hypothetical protein